MKKNTHILLGHGSGGRLSHELIESIFMRHFSNPLLNAKGDAAILPHSERALVYTTDSYVVDPIFFPGGDIGKLAIAGTVNDLSVVGAIPKFLSAGFILEEGLSIEILETIVTSMAEEAKKAGVQIVTGDTKVVDRGKCDKIFINTSGIGQLIQGADHIASGRNIRAGDKIIINGFIGDHGMAVMSARNRLQLKTNIDSDCASLNTLIAIAMSNVASIHFMRDATRGGLATVIAELCEYQNFGINLFEEHIPVREDVKGICELLGFDPLYVANEGKVVIVVEASEAENLIKRLKQHPLGLHSAIIGEIVDSHQGRTWLHTSIGGTRIVDMLAGEQLPRIC